MRSAILLGFCALSCQREPPRDVELYAPLPATVMRAAVSSFDRPVRVVEPPRPPAPSPPPPLPPVHPIRDHVVLPTHPPDPGPGYVKWLDQQSSAVRDAIERHCRANPINFEPVCGGIGPLHVPRPPSLGLPEPVPSDGAPAPAPRDERTRAEWLGALTRVQRGWVRQTCWDHPNQGELCTVMTPLVVSFDGAPVEYTRGARFAFDGAPEPTDWPTAATPWLALDRDGDGAITTGAELFGSSTVLPDGSRARDGFAALAALDANHDGRIDRDDPAFARLVLWADRDGDTRSSANELSPASATIVSISLAAEPIHDCDARSNCAGLVATMRWRDASGGEHTGKVFDVYLPYR